MDRPSLTEIGIRCGTDKADFHRFTDFYEKFFSPIRDQRVRILEVGIWFGSSLKMLKEYFPSGYITGLDNEDKWLLTEGRIQILQGDQANREDLGRAVGQSLYDIIIDDGGHTMAQQQISFGFLFPNVVPGGIYIIEDLHTSFSPIGVAGGWQEPGDRPWDTTLQQLKDVLSGKAYQSKHCREHEVKYINDHIDSIEIFEHPNEMRYGFTSGVTCVIRKKK